MRACWMACRVGVPIGRSGRADISTGDFGERPQKLNDIVQPQNLP